MKQRISGMDVQLEARERARVAALMADGAVFVFGSNRAGLHGRGAALDASKRYGAKWGVGEGPTGRCYALPTKDRPTARDVLSLMEIAGHVYRFIQFAERNPDWTFAVTRVGCGLSGYTDADIAPMFAAAPPNCELPERWRNLAALSRETPAGDEYTYETDPVNQPENMR